MPAQPDADAVRDYVLTALRNSPIGASSRFELAQGLIDRFGTMDRDDARSMISRSLATLQEADQVVVLRPESWDRSGDERVRLSPTGAE